MRNVMMALTMAAVVAAPALAQTPSAGGWVATWTTALVARPAMLPPAPANAAPLIPPMITPNNQTLRQIVHTSIAGTRARVVFANTFGTAPLAVRSTLRTRRW